MKRYLLYMLLFLTWSLIACDDGKIYDETVIVTGEGRTLKLTGQITGVESWPEEYSVVVAGFGDGEFAVASKSVPASAADGEDVYEIISEFQLILYLIICKLISVTFLFLPI